MVATGIVEVRCGLKTRNVSPRKRFKWGIWASVDSVA